MSSVAASSAGTDPRARGGGAARPPSLERDLASTTPDLPRRSPLLSLPGALGWSAGAGAGLGALLLRSRGGFSAGALASGAWRGAALGGVLGAALVALDRATAGEVKRQLDLIALDRRSQLWFVVSHPTRPWLAGTGLAVARDARRAQEQLYGLREPLDGPQDAFRHAYAAALFSLRAIRDHGLDPAEAHRLALAAGAAHERDGQDNNDAHSRAMDHFNNAAGTRVVGDARARAGEVAEARGYVSEPALRSRVLAAIEAGQLRLVDRTGSEPSLAASDSDALPPLLPPAWPPARER